MPLYARSRCFLGALLCAALLVGCGEPESTRLEFWAMGQEGEAVRSLVAEFEHQHPGLAVKVQQIPWSAAHEKLLTAYAGEALPDVVQLGNTWLPEFVTLGALAPLDSHVAADTRADFFPGILATNVIAGQLYGLPWYVDTRLLFYRKDLLAQAGYSAPPKSWEEWTAMLARLKALPGGEHYALLLPMNEWQVPAILGLQLGAELLRDQHRYGDFQSPAFRQAFRFYLDLFRKGYAPAVAEAQVANLYQEFARGYFAFYITGPWNIGEFSRRLPEALQDRWTTAPLPAPAGDSPGLSLAGGASLALTKSARHPTEALALINYLTAAAQQAAFQKLTGDLPARRSAWNTPELANNDRAQAFRTQLERVAPTPPVPEWERIAAKLAHYAEKAVRGEISESEALRQLDADVDQILAKRRWLMAQEQP